MGFNLTRILKSLLIREENTATPKEIEITPGGSAGTKTTIVSTQTTNRTVQLPDVSDFLVTRSGVDQLTNKNIEDSTVDSSPIGSNVPSTAVFTSMESATVIIEGGDIDGTDIGQTTPAAGNFTSLTVLGSPVLSASDSATLTNKKLVDNSTEIIDNTDNTKKILFDAAGSTATSTTLRSNQTSNVILDLPDTSDTLVTRNAAETLQNKEILASDIDNSPIGAVTPSTGAFTSLSASSMNISGDDVVTEAANQSLTNKNLVDSSTLIVDSADNTKQVQIDAGGSTGTKTTIAAAQTANRVVTLPDATDTLVGKNTSDVLTNKELEFLKQSTAADNSSGSSVTLTVTKGITRLTNASLVSITGITAGSDGQHVTLENKTGNAISILNDSGTAVERILTGTGSNLSLPNNASLDFFYDSTNSRWQAKGLNASTSSNDTSNYLNAAFKGFVGTSALMTPTTTPGTPASGQFYSEITGRSSILDLEQDGAVTFGVRQFMVQNIYRLQTEVYGSSGVYTDVYGVTNDKFNTIRLVGYGWQSGTDQTGSGARSALSGDFIEIVFRGTGLNLLTYNNNNDLRVSVNGGSEGSNIAPPSASTILTTRGYSPNQVVKVVSGLTYGTHTVKIRSNAASTFGVHGFQILDETSSLRIRAGKSYLKGLEISNTATTSSYNSSFTNTYGSAGSRGGRVLVYKDVNGNILKDIQYVNTSAQYLTSADHTNEEVSRVLHFREFGANRSDDYSTANTAAAARVFTMDDGGTTLLASGGIVAAIGQNLIEGFYQNGTNNFTITFFGTGLDVFIGANSNNTNIDDYRIYIDGTAFTPGDLTTLSSSRGNLFRIASGLTMGFHTVVFSDLGGGTVDALIQKFIVYRPKTPALPSNCVPLATYNILADYASGTTGVGYIGTGLIRKMLSIREANFSGTWVSPAIDTTNYSSGYSTRTSTSGSYLEYSFYGTAFDLRMVHDNQAQNVTISVNGSSNLSGYTTNFSQSGSGVSFTAATGNLSGTSSSNNKTRLSVSGMSLGLYTVRVSLGNASNMYVDCLDYATPIYSENIVSPTDWQNTSFVGNSALCDERSVSALKDAELLDRNVSEALGTTSNPTTTATTALPVPVPEMSIAHKAKTGRIEINYSIESSNSTGATTNYFYIYVNGLTTGRRKSMTSSDAGVTGATADSIIINVEPGQVVKVDVHWAVSGGTATATLTNRNLTVKDI